MEPSGRIPPADDEEQHHRAQADQSVSALDSPSLRTTRAIRVPDDPLPRTHSVRRTPARFRIALVLVLIVDVLHIVNMRAWLSPQLQVAHRSWFSDLSLPFAGYFLLCFVDDRAPWLQAAAAKALLVFSVATGAELLQGVGIPLLGRTFDPWDIVMYAMGAGVAALLDAIVLSRLIRGWPLVPAADPDRIRVSRP